MDFTPDDQLGLAMPEAEVRTLPRSLRERFVVPPFSVLDRRAGYWQDRRRGWLSLGIKSELGRGENLLSYSDAVRSGGYRNGGTGNLADAGNGKARYDGREEQASDPGTSVFDPVLCELAYRWYCKPGGRILDPFAGGSVRGVVAALLGRSYVGIDLSSAQVKANREQRVQIIEEGDLELDEPPPAPEWIEGSATELGRLLDPDGEEAEPWLADMIFTCPPYADLEVYSDDPRDLSTMTYARFRAAMGYIISEGLARLRPDRFAAIVVGDVRAKDDPGGAFRGFVADTIEQFEEAGARLYNQQIIVDPTGSASIRATKIFDSARKVVTCHQHLLVFVKGDPKKAAAPIVAASKREEPDGAQPSENGRPRDQEEERGAPSLGSEEPAQGGGARGAAGGREPAGGDALPLADRTRAPEPESSEAGEREQDPGWSDEEDGDGLLIDYSREREEHPPWETDAQGQPIRLTPEELKVADVLGECGEHGLHAFEFDALGIDASGDRPVQIARKLYAAGWEIERKIDKNNREMFIMHGERSKTE